MDKLGSIVKGGWHPEKTGSVKGDIKSWVGRGDGETKGARDRAEAHNSTPLSALKDPSSFAPPPRRVGTGTYDSPVASTSSSNSSRPVPLPPRTESGHIDAQSRSDRDDAPPPAPFLADTTGLSTMNLPKPPVRRIGSPVTGSPSRSPNQSTVSSRGAGLRKPPPPLPPRLPPRSAIATPAEPPPSYDEATISSSQQVAPEHDLPLNQSAVDRLGAAGVSVPGFSIGSRTTDTAVPVPDPSLTHVNISELQYRFATLGSAVSNQSKEGQTGSTTNERPALPPKKNIILPTKSTETEQDSRPEPPPVPIGTKPR